jgi:hypothetical protein
MYLGLLEYGGDVGLTAYLLGCVRYRTDLTLAVKYREALIVAI